MDNCLFCRIAAKEIPTKVAYEDDVMLAFWDISPQAPVHLLLIPKKHIASVAELLPEDQPLVGHMMLKARDLAREQGLADGYRLVINTGEQGGQTVDHLHIHLLGGRNLQWPPG
jgi:histidine triad (HIT) family protein